MTQDPDFATKPTLTGERAILRPFVDADTPDLLAAAAFGGKGTVTVAEYTSGREC